MRRLVIAIALLLGMVGYTIAATYTTHYRLTKPARGATNWDTSINTDMDTIDSALYGIDSAYKAYDAYLYQQILLKYGDLVARMGDLPEIYIMTGTFNGPTGAVLTLPKAVSEVSEYAVAVETTARTGPVGDVYVTQSTTTATVHCSASNTTDSFKAIIIYSDDQNYYGSAIHRKWYVSPLDSITNHCDAATTGSLAWVLAQVDVYYATVELPGNHQYDVTDNCTVPSNVQLQFQRGALLNVTPGKSISMDSPRQILAGEDQQIVEGIRRGIRFDRPGRAHAAWWGTDSSGATDAYPDLNATIDSCPENSMVVLRDGNYSLDTGLYIHNGVSLTGVCGEKGTVLKTTSALDSMIYIKTDTQVQINAPQLQTVQCLELDGGNAASYGLNIATGYRMNIEKNKFHYFTVAGAFVNGHVKTYLGNLSWIFNVHFKDNSFGNNGMYGARITRDWGDNETDWGDNNTLNWRAYDRISFDGDFFGQNPYQLFCKGDNKTTDNPSGFSVTAQNVVFEGTNVEANIRLKDGATMILTNPYIETSNTGGDGISRHYWLTNHTRLESNGGPGAFWTERYEDNSTACFTNGYSGSLFSQTGSPVSRVCVGDRISDKKAPGGAIQGSWGSPNWPIVTFFPNYPCQNHSCGGFQAWKGMVSVDAAGNEWLQVDDNYTAYGASMGKVSNASRWSPKTGRIIIPFDKEDMNHQNIPFFWAEANFVLTGLDIVIEVDFKNDAGESDPTYGLTIGSYPAGWDDYIGLQTVRGAQAANLTAGNVIRAWDNNDTTASHGLLSWVADSPTRHRAKYMPGYSTRVMDLAYVWMTTYKDTYIIGRPNPYTGWNQGKGYLIITGYPLEYDK